MCDNFTLWNTLKQFISYTCNTKKRAAPEMLFQLLRYRTLLSRNSVAGGNNRANGEYEVAIA